MRQEALIVAFGEVGALVRAARLLPAQGRLDDSFGDIEHEGHLQGGDPFGVERPTAILDGEIAEALLQPAQRVRGPRQRVARTMG